MLRVFVCVVVVIACVGLVNGSVSGQCGGEGDATTDWLVSPCTTPATASHDASTNTFSISNGVVSRTLTLDPTTNLLATTSLKSLTGTGEKLRSPTTELSMVVNGVQTLAGGPTPSSGDTRPRMTFSGYAFTNSTKAGGFHWVPGTRHTPTFNRAWPPLGVTAAFNHTVACSAVNAGDSGTLTATVEVELYEGTSAFGRRVRLSSSCSQPLFVFNMTVASLATAIDRSVEWTHDAAVATETRAMDLPTGDGGDAGSVVFLPIGGGLVQTSTYGPGLSSFSPSDSFESFYVLEIVHDARFYTPTKDPSKPRGMLRYGLETSRCMRTVAPQIEQYPILVSAMCHGGSKVPPLDGVAGSIDQWCYDEEGTQGLQTLIDQCADAGVESIGVAQNMNSTWRSLVGNEFVSEANTTWFKNLTARAREQGMDFGAYQLLLNARSATALNQAALPNAAELPMDGYDTMDPVLMKGCHHKAKASCTGGSACCSMCGASEFFVTMRDSMLEWTDATGAKVFFVDGSESDHACANASHAGHHGLNDSIWMQYSNVRDLYHSYRARGGLIVGMPGSVVGAGQSKVPGGYDEMTYSLSAWDWIHRIRMNIIAGPHERDAFSTNGVRFFPLPWTSPYHPNEPNADGSAWQPASGYITKATVAPLETNLLTAEWALSLAFGTGSQFEFRAPWLWDGPKSEALFKQWVAWAKTYRGILATEVVTVAHYTQCWGNEPLRPNSTCTFHGLDAVLHRAPKGWQPDVEERGLLMVWNPTEAVVNTTLTLPLYYSGLSASAGVSKVAIREKEGSPASFPLGVNDTVALPVSVPSMAVTWFVVTEE